MKKKLRQITAAAITLILSITNVPAVMAQQDADVFSTVVLSNGEEKQVNQNPYGSGVTRLEYRIIEEMRKAAAELGVDITTDFSYQSLEPTRYNTLSFDFNYLDALQVDFYLNLIQNAKKMIQDAITEKKNMPATENPNTEDLITEGIFAGFTKQERQDLLVKVNDKYMMDELARIDIYYQDLWYGDIILDGFKSTNIYKYSVLKGSVSGNNYVVRDIFAKDSSETEQIRQQVAKYFKDSESYTVERFKTYPEENKLNGTIEIEVDNVLISFYEDSSMALYYISTDGTVTKVPHTYDTANYKHLLTFETDELGYFAWGIKNEALVEEPEPTETPVNSPAPTDTVVSPSKVAPKTGDSMNVVIPIIAILASIVVLGGVRFKEQFEK